MGERSCWSSCSWTTRLQPFTDVDFADVLPPWEVGRDVWLGNAKYLPGCNSGVFRTIPDWCVDRRECGRRTPEALEQPAVRRPCLPVAVPSCQVACTTPSRPRRWLGVVVVAGRIGRRSPSTLRGPMHSRLDVRTPLRIAASTSSWTASRRSRPTISSDSFGGQLRLERVRMTTSVPHGRVAAVADGWGAVPHCA